MNENKQIAKIAVAKLIESGVPEDDLFLSESPVVLPVEECGDVTGYWVAVEVWVGKGEV
jgi:hypothetical protein